MRRPNISKTNGFSLVELTITLALMGLVLFGVFSLIISLRGYGIMLDSNTSAEEHRRLIRFALNATVRQAIPIEVFMNKELIESWGLPVPPTLTKNYQHSGLVYPMHMIGDNGRVAPTAIENSFVLAMIVKSEGGQSLDIIRDPANPEEEYYISPPGSSTGRLIVESDLAAAGYVTGDYIGISTSLGVCIVRITSISGNALQFEQRHGTYLVDGIPNPLPIRVFMQGQAIYKVGVRVFGTYFADNKLNLASYEVDMQSLTNRYLNSEIITEVSNTKLLVHSPTTLQFENLLTSQNFRPGERGLFLSLTLMERLSFANRSDLQERKHRDVALEVSL